MRRRRCWRTGRRSGPGRGRDRREVDHAVHRVPALVDAPVNASKTWPKSVRSTLVKRTPRAGRRRRDVDVPDLVAVVDELGDGRPTELAAATGDDDPHASTSAWFACRPSIMARPRSAARGRLIPPGAARAPPAYGSSILEPRPVAGGPPARERRERRSIRAPRRSTARAVARVVGLLRLVGYADAHDIEYNAIREAAALIDVSPLYKYRRRRAGCAPPGRPGHHPRCDEADGRPGLLHALVRRARQGHRRRHGPPPRRAATFRWTAADPQLRWLRMNSAGLDVDDRGRHRERRPPSPSRGRSSRAVLEAATGESFARAALLPAPGAPRKVGRKRRRSTSRGPATPATSATSCGSRPSSAVDVWDALIAAGPDYAHPAGRDAGPRRRRGSRPASILLEVDYTSARHAHEPGPELLARRDRAGPAGRPRQGATSSAGWRSSARPAPAARRGGWSASQLDWYDIEGL